nr:MAG TPA: hypothetical protein [Caudoviricetes sp.]
MSKRKLALTLAARQYSVMELGLPPQTVQCGLPPRTMTVHTQKAPAMSLPAIISSGNPSAVGTAVRPNIPNSGGRSKHVRCQTFNECRPMMKRNFIKVCLRQGESLNWENFNNRICVLVLQGSIVVFGRHGKMLFRLNAGEANVFEGTPECTGTSVTNDTEVIIV